ncbi:MAG TPA: ATP-binding protein [Geobacteraceae bacterium]
MRDNKGIDGTACGNIGTGSRGSVRTTGEKGADGAAEAMEWQRVNAALERRVIELTREREAANRTLEEFCYSISHGLRAPLMAMSGFSQVLLEIFADRLDGEALEYLKQIDTASQRMSQMIGGLASMSLCISGEFRRVPLNLSAMAEHICRELSRAEPERRVQWRVEPGLRALGDSRMIEVVLRNLLENAWKFTAGQARAEVSFYAERIRGELFYCVADNGAGFDMACAKKLFRPFQRLHGQDEFTGIGIGLATAQRIVHRHGGVLKAKGAPAHGATFRFTLPSEERQETEAP